VRSGLEPAGEQVDEVDLATARQFVDAAPPIAAATAT
jgi:hypothetical protein